MIPVWRDEKVKQIAQRPEIRASIEVILSVFAVLFLLFVAIRPTLAIVATLQKKIEDQNTVDRKLSNKVTQLIKATADMSTYGDKLPLFNQAVTDETARAGLAKRIELLADENNLAVNQFTFTAVPLLGQNIKLSDKTKGGQKPEAEKGSSITSFEVNLDVKGNLDNLMSFISKLENMDRLVMLKSLDFKKEVSKDETGQELQTIRLTGKAVVYYRL